MNVISFNVFEIVNFYLITFVAILDGEKLFVQRSHEIRHTINAY